MIQKKGLSTIVVTLIIILLSLVAVGIVWVVVRNIIQTGAEGLDLTQFALNAKVMNVLVDNNTNNISLTIKREPGKGEIEGFNFIFFSDTDNEVIRRSVSLNELEQRNFMFHLENISVGNVISISVVPIIKQNGKEILGIPFAKYKLGESKNIQQEQTCIPSNCSSLGYTCGSGYANGTCSGTLNCGNCSSGNICINKHCVANYTPSTCLAIPDIYSVSFPQYYDQPNSPNFNYSFQIKRANQSNATTVIVIGGGPGSLVIGTYGMGAIPNSSFNIVYTDIRGQGCNKNLTGSYSLDFYRTDRAAMDIVYLISALNLKDKDYIIYGLSYGTIQGTVVTSIIDTNLPNQKPKALVLEGVCGGNLDPIESYIPNTLDFEWQHTFSLLKPETQNLFIANDSAVNISSKDWAIFIKEALYSGEVPISGNILRLYLDYLTDPNPALRDAVRTIIVQTINQTKMKSNSSYPTILYIGCREVMSKLPLDIDLVNHHLVSIADECGAASLSLSNPYDSFNFQTTTPIYYFQGTRDASPCNYQQALYHYSTHTATTRKFVAVQNASHNPLSLTLKLTNCTGNLWNAIDKNSSNFSVALSTCAWNATILP